MSDLRPAIFAEIRRIFADELDRPGPVEPQHALAADLRIDSMGALILAVGLEDHFRVKLFELDAATVVTVADLVDVVERRLREAAALGNCDADDQRSAR